MNLVLVSSIFVMGFAIDQYRKAGDAMHASGGLSFAIYCALQLLGFGGSQTAMLVLPAIIYLFVMAWFLVIILRRKWPFVIWVGVHKYHPSEIGFRQIV